MEATANRISPLSSSATRKLLLPCVLAFMIVLGLVALAPSTQAQTFTLLHSFTGGAEAGNPDAGVVRDSAGNLYGTTQYGGAYNFGTVFKLDSADNETVLYNFTGAPDGARPFAGVMLDAAGNLYGTTQYGGVVACYGVLPGCGTVFKLDTTGKETILYSFIGPPDSWHPYFSSLVRDAAGNLYGTSTQSGGANGYGTVFKLDTTGNETVLYRFTRGGDGAQPAAGVMRDAAGNLYGTTVRGGAYSWGTLFKLDATGKETVLHSFTGGSDGSEPFAGLIHDQAGNLYGTTQGGGLGYGTVFKLDKTGKETVLYGFTGGADGSIPFAGVTRDAAGNLYGTTYYGGASGYGTVFKVDANGTETVLHSFTFGSDGANPVGDVIRDAGGNLYGTTYDGGDPICGCGTVFKIAP